VRKELMLVVLTKGQWKENAVVCVLTALTNLEFLSLGCLSEARPSRALGKRVPTLLA
jgi:hypothetical protein